MITGFLTVILVATLVLLGLAPGNARSGLFRGANDGVQGAMDKLIDDERQVDRAKIGAGAGAGGGAVPDGDSGGGASTNGGVGKSGGKDQSTKGTTAPAAAADDANTMTSPATSPGTVKKGGNDIGLPQILYDRKVYDKSDFTKGPTFWNQTFACAGTQCRSVWGPCFPPMGKPELEKEVDRLATKGSKLHYSPRPSLATRDSVKNVDGLCRPGFLIIGQGKCGTSSLYHYLDGHPRVVPASEKQIHYFKYYASYSMRWYMSHFPLATSFVASGALITGEASPGYLPYPDVAALVSKRLPGTKIICVGRDPLDRSYSSYRYNYINPAITKLRKGHHKGIKGGQPDEYYHQFLFSFEEMMQAELKQLKACLAPGGPGETGAARSWMHTAWGKDAFDRVSKDGKPKLVDLDGHCYGKFYSTKAPRKQWIELSKANPEKFLAVPNLHLAQAMIGRSLYTYPLEWWYTMFPEEDVYFLCTEEMQDLSGNPLGAVADFLGLPSFNFSDVVSAGMYNVGGHKGYDTMTSWETAMEEHDTQEEKREIPLSKEFRKELLGFFKPHNERLFKLVGRRCNWQTK